MQTIKILDRHEAIKIAAGEVVERPSHMLKELLENSIDAGATTIVVRCEKAGKRYLSIEDNGFGMSAEDARLCFMHHATSKITKVDDLQSIATYGFRGEALSSIAAVARVELVTRSEDCETALSVIMDQGVKVDEQIATRARGTTITVSQLFEAIPARKKFLKSDETEWNALVTLFQAFCMRYEHIHFKLFHNGYLAYHCPPVSSLSDRVLQIWGTETAQHILMIEQKDNVQESVSGVITDMHYHRYNRNQMFIFVNNRWVKNVELARAIMKGYHTVLPPQKYPAVVLFIHVNPSDLDINIHPKKEEVKFLHPGIVQSLVQKSIAKALEQQILAKPQDEKRPSMYQDVPKVFERASAYKQDVVSDTMYKNESPKLHAYTPSFKPRTTVSESIQHIFQDPFIESVFSESRVSAVVQNETIPAVEEHAYTIIGQYAQTYIVVEKKGSLMLIDQHAAHERILYESYKEHFENIATVSLLFPHIISLSPHDCTLLLPHLAIFKQHGIVLEPLNDRELLVQATPVALQSKAVSDIIETTLGWIKEHAVSLEADDFFKALHQSLHAQKACKAAYKAGDLLLREQMDALVRSLFKTEHCFTCPHGRPTVWDMSLIDIEKKFKRDYKSNVRNNVW